MGIFDSLFGDGDAGPAPKPDDGLERSARKQEKLGKKALITAKVKGEGQEALGKDALTSAKSIGKDIARIGADYLSFAKDQFKISQQRQGQIDKITKQATQFFTKAAQQDRARYEQVFKPLEDQFIKDAQEYDSVDRQTEAAAKAKADVASEAALQRGAQERSLASAGVRPDSGRFAGIDRATGVNEAAVSVGAQNNARQNLRDRGAGMRQQAAGLGQGLTERAVNTMGAGVDVTGQANAQWLQTPGIVNPGFTAAQTGKAQQSDATARGFGQAQTGLAHGAHTLATGYGLGMEGYRGAGNIYSGMHDQNIGIWNTQSEIDAANAKGAGEFAGTVIGAGAKLLPLLSTKKAKKNRKEVPEGDALAAVEGIPVEEYQYKDGFADGGESRHVGPMAEDFAAATGKGDGRTIPIQDLLGVAMGAIKDLNTKVDRIANAVGIGEHGNG